MQMEVLKPLTENIDAPQVIDAVLSGGVAEAVFRDPLFGEVNPNYTSATRETTALAIVGSTLLANAVEYGSLYVGAAQMPSELHGIHTHVMLAKMNDAALVVWDRTSGYVAPRPEGARMLRRHSAAALDVTPRVRGVYRSPEVKMARSIVAAAGVTGFGLKYGIESALQGEDLDRYIDTIALGTAGGAVVTGAMFHTWNLFGGMIGAKRARQEYLRLRAGQ